MRWTFDSAPPRGLLVWCLVEGGGDEPYLVRGNDEGDPWKSEFSIDTSTDDIRFQYLPPHHTIIAWRRA